MTENIKKLEAWKATLVGISPLLHSPIQTIHLKAKRGEINTTVIATLDGGIRFIGYSDKQNRYVGQEYAASSVDIGEGDDHE